MKLNDPSLPYRAAKQRLLNQIHYSPATRDRIAQIVFSFEGWSRLPQSSSLSGLLPVMRRAGIFDAAEASERAPVEAMTRDLDQEISLITLSQTDKAGAKALSELLSFTTTDSAIYNQTVKDLETLETLCKELPDPMTINERTIARAIAIEDASRCAEWC